MADATAGRVALLSVKPRFAEAILDGDKTVELRKQRFGADVSLVLIYATSPVARIVGWFEVGNIDAAKPATLWRKYREATGISAAEFKGYYGGAEVGYAITVDRAARLDEPIPLIHVGIASAPQNFRYLPGSIGMAVVNPPVARRWLRWLGRSALAVIRRRHDPFVTPRGVQPYISDTRCDRGAGLASRPFPESLP
jgi:predicted transcriptional regulator